MRGAFEDLTGQRFGRLTVTHEAQKIGKRIRWHVVCDCGREKDVDAKNLRAGKTKSCGCLRRENNGRAANRDWAARQPSPRNMKGLCYNVYCPERNNYRKSVWSCSRCRLCQDRVRYRVSNGINSR